MTGFKRDNICAHRRPKVVFKDDWLIGTARYLVDMGAYLWSNRVTTEGLRLGLVWVSKCLKLCIHICLLDKTGLKCNELLSVFLICQRKSGRWNCKRYHRGNSGPSGCGSTEWGLHWTKLFVLRKCTFRGRSIRLGIWGVWRSRQQPWALHVLGPGELGVHWVFFVYFMDSYWTENCYINIFLKNIQRRCL